MSAPIRGRGEGGSATAEAAVALPVLVLVLAMALWVLVAVSVQLRCTDAAGVAARAAARGESLARVAEAGRAVAPAGAAVDVRRTGDSVQVRVGVRVHPPGRVLARLGGLQVSGRAVAARESRAGTP